MRLFPPKVFVSSALLLGLLMVWTSPGMAQSRAVKGKVTDENGQPVEGAKIKIEGTDIYRVFETKTNKKGEYFHLLGLQSGVYRVIVRKDGFQPAYQENVRAEMGEEKAVDFQLTPGKDRKLPFEMSDADKAEYMKKYEEQQKRMKFSAEVQAKFNQGVTFFDAGQYAEALAEFQAALEIDPKQPGIMARIGDCLLKLDRKEEALDSYNKAIELHPEDPSFYTNKGVILSQMGRAEESQEMFKKAAELDPMAAAQNFYNLGVTMVNTGDIDNAVAAFRRSIEADPGYAESYYQLGMSLSGNLKTIPEAISSLKKYLELGQKPEQVEVAKQIISALEASQ
ncbi:MAG: tetratricopeptide repeat protein [Acidobacteriota bacterium]|jgi:tetratricopeptide (TPR) repeat protein|nr:tetratricopeptide repeat protein [Acidobacteriota bacterium]NLT31944.1 tetratricopeptide repeat protein [Acidobacteriota bacterium]